MKSYLTISTTNYCIREITCRCISCNEVFLEHIPNDYELVQLVCNDGKKRYLPTYSKYGYLFLLPHLVDGWSASKTITQKVSDTFISKLSELCPYKVRLSGTSQLQCPHCRSRRISIQEEKICHNVAVDWIEIQEDFIKSLCEGDH